MAFRMDDISINTIIGEGTRFTGDLQVSGCIRIDGDILGNIESSGEVMINGKARIRGNISAKSVIVSGVVCGNIIAAENVYLFSTSAVFGDVLSRSLQAEDDVILNGRCLSLKDENSYLEALARWKDLQIIEERSFRRGETFSGG